LDIGSRPQYRTQKKLPVSHLWYLHDWAEHPSNSC
jgi:hypothetical protein